MFETQAIINLVKSRTDLLHNNTCKRCLQNVTGMGISKTELGMSKVLSVHGNVEIESLAGVFCFEIKMLVNIVQNSG